MKPLPWILASAFWLVGTTASAQLLPGFVTVDAEGKAQLHFMQELPKGQAIFFQTPSGKGHFKCCVRVSANDLEKLPEASPDVMADEDKPIASYVLKQRLNGQFRTGFTALAVSAQRASSSGAYAIVANNGRTTTRTRLCYGQEGVNLIARTGREVHTLYRSFDYDIEARPKCNAEDLRDLGG